MTQNGKPAESTANAANADAAAGDEKNTTATQRDTEREEGRTQKEAPAAEAAAATSPGTGAEQLAGEGTERQDTEARGKRKEGEETTTKTSKTTDRNNPSHFFNAKGVKGRQWGSGGNPQIKYAKQPCSADAAKPLTSVAIMEKLGEPRGD